MLVYDSSKAELQEVKRQIYDLAACLTDEKWDVACFSDLRETEAFCAGNPLLHLACYDVTEAGSLDCLSRIRSGQADMLLMLVADGKMSPMEYVRPDIFASSLIIRPFGSGLLRDKLRDLILKYLERLEQDDSAECFMLDTKEGVTSIPYRRIYYMEARDKRIYLRLCDREYAFYGTMDELERRLPDSFLRCHRSFLINRQYVEKILLTQGEIHLSHGITVPLSRSYKPCFKQFWQERLWKN
ncbi:MAG: LytTR family transcriptional regulator DNA-binding domain-containing protein [Blautia sp.]|nr:LytTR family transcriptional regulator DNA-binding domain-containing protein [Blautia sp.]